VGRPRGSVARAGEYEVRWHFKITLSLTLHESRLCSSVLKWSDGVADKKKPRSEVDFEELQRGGVLKKNGEWWEILDIARLPRNLKIKAAGPDGFKFLPPKPQESVH
jgi:hypothetical protein